MARLRLFFALDIDDKLRESLHLFQNGLDTALFRPLKKENLHITLAFLGDRDEEDVPVLGDILFSLPWPDKIILTAKRLVFFPSMRRPSSIAVDIKNPNNSLFDMQKNLVRELVVNGFSIERRAYRPHITLAYLKKALDASLLELPALPSIPRFSPVSVSLISSRLARGGSVFTTLCQRKFM